MGGLSRAVQPQGGGVQRASWGSGRPEPHLKAGPGVWEPSLSAGVCTLTSVSLQEGCGGAVSVFVNGACRPELQAQCSDERRCLAQRGGSVLRPPHLLFMTAGMALGPSSSQLCLGVAMVPDGRALDGRLDSCALEGG